MSVLHLDRVGLRYRGAGRDALTDVDLVLRAGEFHFLLGPSGAGKTSLLRVLSLSESPSQGRVRLFGRDVRSLTGAETGALRRRIGVIFQDFRLLDHLSAFDNVALPLRIAGADDAEIASFVCELLSWLGLADQLETRPPDLSIGQRQRVAAARAVVTRPSILLADEPTSNVDGRNADRLMHLFTELHKLGTTVIVATHNLELVRRYPHPTLLMNDGMLAHAPAERVRLAAAG
ncbi:cell division ATP-binding protein FtsE [Marinivivus vitaminiproducens]|uniref:cell division ATP-binding protein FtsE n=1 Tax=Marinivivus vitaminiproducens TaxID=3035935 RepID=UPI0027A2CCBB|nr:ATP-binding cassette domain-containing protein [Geminicoccaceae bacterium SCSIO 64248]